MKIEIPGYGELNLSHLLLDYNGTIATDGVIPEKVKETLEELSKELKIYVLTADTHGTAAMQCESLNISLRTFPVGNAADHKVAAVDEFGGQNCVCIGNGRNDILMFRKAALSIAVIGTEGMYAGLLKEADICVKSIEDALDLLRYPKRIIADMRG